jgi:hypothetical protein
VTAWTEKGRKEALRIASTIGFSFESREDLEGQFNNWYDQLDSLLKPNSSVFRCFEDERCDEYDVSKNDFDEVVNKSLDESVLSNANTISKLVEQSKELATVTCNNNGFYE